MNALQVELLGRVQAAAERQSGDSHALSRMEPRLNLPCISTMDHSFGRSPPTVRQSRICDQADVSCRNYSVFVSGNSSSSTYRYLGFM